MSSVVFDGDPREVSAMRYGLVLGMLGVVLVCHEVGRVPGEEAPAEKGPAWLDDYAAARRAARLSGKPIFAVFR
jgi:hypothetical protein